jgi:hypothetical protein
LNCDSPNCPIQPELEKVNQLSGDLATTIRRLRHDLKACRRCPVTPCKQRDTFSELIRAALTQMIEEWNL